MEREGPGRTADVADRWVEEADTRARLNFLFARLCIFLRSCRIFVSADMVSFVLFRWVDTREIIQFPPK